MSWSVTDHLTRTLCFDRLGTEVYHQYSARLRKVGDIISRTGVNQNQVKVRRTSTCLAATVTSPSEGVRWEELPSMAGANGNVSQHFWKTELPSREVTTATALTNELWPRKQGEE